MKNLIVLVFLSFGISCQPQDRNTTMQDTTNQTETQPKQDRVPGQVPEGCIDPSKIDPEAMCIQVWDPVCGCDGKTYSNDCVAQAAGLTSWTKAECE